MSKSPNQSVKIFPRSMRLVALVVLVLIGWVHQVVAFENRPEVMIVEGSYTKTDSDAGKPQKLSITSEQIELIKPSSVTSLLRTVPGVNVTQQGGEGGLTFVSLRGGEPNFTVVVIDGVKVNDTTNSRGGGFDLAGLDPLLVKSIDLFVGGFSSIYGSEALGGVLSISTFDADAADRDLTLELGSDNARATAFRWSGDVAQQFGYAVAAVTRQAAESVPGDQLERKQLNMQVFSRPEAALQWSGSWFHSEGDASGFPEDSGGDQLAVFDGLEVRSFRQNNARLAASGLLGEHWTLDIAGAYSEHREKTDHPGIAPGELSAVPTYVSESQYQRRDLSLIANYQSQIFATAMGVEFSREQGEFTSLIDFGFPLPADFQLSRNNVAIFAETIFSVSPDLTLSGSVRRDDVDEFQQRTLSAQVNYLLPNGFGALSLRYGEGFKVPSFFALGHPLVGNTALEPEQSENISASYKLDLFDEQLNISTSLFQNRFTDLVDFDPDLFTNVNRSKIEVEGIEGQLKWRVNDRLLLDTSATYSKYDTPQEVVLRRRPEWKYAASAAWAINELTNLSLRAWYVDEFYDSSIPTGLVSMAGHHQLDASLARTLSERFELGIMLSNIGDNQYQEALGFSNSGRQLRLSLTAKL